MSRRSKVLTPCEKALRFCKRIGIAVGICIGAAIWISGVGNILQELFGGQNCRTFTNGAISCSSSPLDGAGAYLAAAVVTTLFAVASLFIAAAWNDD
jgi:hypothetical protein